MSGSIRERVSLRTQLVGVVLLLGALTVITTSVVVAVLLRSQLIEAVDDELQQSARPIVERVARGDLPPPPPSAAEDPFRRSALSVTVLDESGAVVAEQAPTSTDLGGPALPPLDQQTVAEQAGRPFTVDAEGGGSWRAVALVVGDGSVVIALPLTAVQQTMRQLIVIDVALAVVALVVLAVLARWAVSASLRPLVEVERTAHAIASGDLSQRVPEHPSTTEVGRLSASLNAMLAQIETAVTEQRHAAEAAQESEERMRRFVADASHELRTPLTSIRGFAELYRQGAVPPGASLDQTMGRIEDEARRMGLLVDDLLLLARLGQQRRVERLPVDLVPLATEVVHDAALVSPSHPVSLQLPPDQQPAVVLGDDARLRQVLSNLVRNALTHTPEGTPVRVGIIPRGEDVAVVVSDDGPGMTPEQAQRAFDRFYRADAARSRATGSGSGLGLAIVAALVAAHGGTVDLQAEPGQGTTVTVHLPSVEAEHQSR